MLALIILGAVALALAVAIGWFYLYSRTESWRRSDVRMATMGLLMSIGPMFGMRFKPNPPEVPTVSTPYDEPPDETGPHLEDDAPPRQPDHRSGPRLEERGSARPPHDQSGSHAEKPESSPPADDQSDRKERL